MATPVALISPDSRGRFTLSKWLAKDTEYEVYVLGSGHLELVEVKDA